MKGTPQEQPRDPVGSGLRLECDIHQGIWPGTGFIDKFPSGFRQRWLFLGPVQIYNRRSKSLANPYGLPNELVE